MPQIARPVKRAGTTAYVTEAARGARGNAVDLDTDLNLPYTTVNQLDAANFPVGSIGAAAFADGALTATVLGPGLPLSFVDFRQSAGAAAGTFGTETLLTQSQWTARGGIVVVLGVASVGGAFGGGGIELRLRHGGIPSVVDGTVIRLADLDQVDAGGGGPRTGVAPLVFHTMVPPAESGELWKLTLVAGVIGSPVTVSWQWFVAEFA